MKLVIIMSLVAISVAYKDIPASYNYEEVLNNKDKLHDFFGCFLDKNVCSDSTAHIKSHLQELIFNGCKDCDLRQKHYAHLLTSSLKDKFPQEYQEYRTKFDPEGKYFSKFEAALLPY